MIESQADEIEVAPPRASAASGASRRLRPALQLSHDPADEAAQARARGGHRAPIRAAAATIDWRRRPVARTSPDMAPTRDSTSCAPARALRPLGAIALALTLPACAEPPTVDDGAGRVPAFREAWLPVDDPSILDDSFTYDFAALPLAGEVARTPWPGFYWPTYLDGINYRWAGADVPSPAEKYGLAFDVPGVEDAVSASFGVDSLFSASCTSDAECDGAICAKRRGEAEGRCAETWFGICHAWAPAALLEAEPRRAVTYNGVEFRVNDLKALISLVYTDGLEVRFLSLRCNEKGSEGDIGDLEECKDTNAGTFHVVVANLIGLRGESFIEDRTYDYEVWNQPVVGYTVTVDEALSGAAANELLGATGEHLRGGETPGSVDAGAWVRYLEYAVAPGERLRVRIRGTGDADLHVRWDLEPTATLYDCRPYLPGSDELCELTVPEGVSAAHIGVFGYEAATYDLEVDVFGPTPTTYAFNPEAASLRRLQTEIRWIGESPAAIDGPLVPRAEEFTHTDVYDYVLELDGAGEIIGGEWLGASRTMHPDFLWLPIRKAPGQVVGAVEYDDVRMLLELAASP